MTRASAHGLTAPRATDWRDTALCRTPQYRNQADMWFATAHDKTDRNSAEQTCRACPSLHPCAVWAVLAGIKYGTWGALHEEQRATIRRRLGPERRNQRAAVTAAVHHALNTTVDRPRTLQTIWAERTYPLPGGHLGWRGKPAVQYGGRPYTKKQVAFCVSRGRMPDGCVRRMCEVEACVLPGHVTDGRERARLAAAEVMPEVAA